jgi:AraC-like DNA-binding protein
MNLQSSKTWQLRFKRLPHLENVELLHAINVTHDYPPHIHEEYSFAVVLGGIETTVCRNATFTARRGNVLIVNPEEVHSNKSIKSEYRVIKVPTETIDRLTQEFSGTPPPVFFPDPVLNDRVMFRKLLELQLKLELPASSLEHESLFLATMRRLMGGANKKFSSKTDNRYVGLVREYLRAHYAENVTLSQLTSLTTLSPFYLLRMFRNSTGVPPHEYQTQVRIAHARKLIRTGSPLSEVALETGFFDQSHLSRNFKRIVGITPRQYYDGKEVSTTSR